MTLPGLDPAYDYLASQAIKELDPIPELYRALKLYGVFEAEGAYALMDYVNENGFEHPYPMDPFLVTDNVQLGPAAAASFVVQETDTNVQEIMKMDWTLRHYVEPSDGKMPTYHELLSSYKLIAEEKGTPNTKVRDWARIGNQGFVFSVLAIGGHAITNAHFSFSLYRIDKPFTCNDAWLSVDLLPKLNLANTGDTADGARKTLNEKVPYRARGKAEELKMYLARLCIEKKRSEVLVNGHADAQKVATALADLFDLSFEIKFPHTIDVSGLPWVEQ